MVSTLTPLESAVLEALLQPSGDPFDALRQQLAHASVAKREFSGVGFFTHFSLPTDARIRRDLSDCQLGSIGADIAGLQHGAGFLLFVRDGVVSFLEGFSYDEPWPAEVKEFRVYAHQTI
ncbi:MAG: hypothetical protein DMF06_11070 [Verrucomicrobia bacterium]|nr:MAG: hypothetical protein DMF06_11070 [Verrucomicrobiota bacterium]